MLEKTARPLIETLEGRRLLSASVSETLRSDLVYAANSAATSPGDISGYTPAEIRTAYGFSNVSLGSAVTANGAGQTIAIVDAYNDPNIKSDLSAFDTEFGITAPANFKVVNQAGGPTLPATNAGWATEISLDVEWAHATAPGANILLVEASSANTDDLMAAVNYARNAAGVSVVSMSWGGSEFFDWADGGESESQLTYDPDFTTPAGHQGVTFVAAAGDSGARDGVQWPASSPNVLSVGGTTLTTSDSSGTYESEAGWTGTSSGYSQVETEPTYQDAVQNSGARSVADVAYDADPNTGFAIYDSLTYEGYAGWQEVGGTSAGAPQWAALVAIADQGRVLNGDDTLDGATQTLSTLYSLYSAPDTTGYSSYTSDFNDVLDGGGQRQHNRWGGDGSSDGSAGPGYDLVTGLGSPIASSIVDALVGSSDLSSGGSGSTGGSGGGSTTPSTLPASPLSGTFTGDLPVAVIGGKAGSVTLSLTNTSDAAFSGPVTLTLYASTSTSITSDSTLVTTLPLARLSEKIDGSHAVKIKFEYPLSLTGDYYLIASISATDSATEAVTAPATAVTATTVNLAPPAVDLSITFASGKLITVDPGKEETAIITITNLGNVTAAGSLDLVLDASSDGTIDETAIRLATVNGRKLKIAAGKSIRMAVKFKSLADELGGTYDLIASITPTTTPADTNTANDMAEIGTVAP